MMTRIPSWIMAVLAFLLLFFRIAEADEPLRMAHFHVDVSPPVGSPLAYDPCIGVIEPLSFHGVILIGNDQPIVLGVVDWLGVANDSHEFWRERLAVAVGTVRERVALHAVHQHDAPRCDLGAAALLAEIGQAEKYYDVPWIRDCVERTCVAAKEAIEKSIVVDRIGLGAAEVVEVASNRRLLDENGRVYATRYTATADPKLRDAPTGVVDPLLRSVTFYSAEKPVLVLTYFAVHPQSYYRTGQANPDFPGYARNQRAQESGVTHVHFNGAGGNIGAGKWNDGARENRAVLAGKVQQAMRLAFENSETIAISASELNWTALSVQLPIAEHLNEQALLSTLQAPDTNHVERVAAAEDLTWLRRSQAGSKIDVQCLSLGKARILHLPGELFVEYQLNAAMKRPDLFVATAAYGEYGSGYIGTEVAYGQGGYETSARASRVAPTSEKVLMNAIDELLNK